MYIWIASGYGCAASGNAAAPPNRCAPSAQWRADKNEMPCMHTRTSSVPTMARAAARTEWMRLMSFAIFSRTLFERRRKRVFLSVSTAIGLLASVLAGCAVGPDYVRPEMEMPAGFKEAQDWKPAQPRDQAPT